MARSLEPSASNHLGGVWRPAYRRSSRQTTLWQRQFLREAAVSWPKQGLLQPFTTTATQADLGYYHGYRDYDQRSLDGAPVELVFPFGHGLSYTSFKYSNLQLPCSSATKQGLMEVSVDVTNTGPVAGEEVVMLFVAGPTDPPAAAQSRNSRAFKRST